ncbi:hypothetical protein D3C75_1148350 [compost metagenome]
MNFQTRAWGRDERTFLDRLNLLFEPDLSKFIVSGGVSLGFPGFFAHLAATQCIGQAGQRKQGLLLKEFSQGRRLGVCLGFSLFNAL